MENILHLYLGCDVIVTRPRVDPFKCKLTGITTKQRFPEGNAIRFQVCRDDVIGWYDIEDVKLLLRPISSMTEDDIKEWGNVKITQTPYCVELDSIEEFGEFTEIYPDGTIHSKSKDDNDTRPINGGKLFAILLKIGFDLFNLIPEGKALDATKVSTTTPY